MANSKLKTAILLLIIASSFLFLTAVTSAIGAFSESNIENITETITTIMPSIEEEMLKQFVSTYVLASFVLNIVASLLAVATFVLTLIIKNVWKQTYGDIRKRKGIIIALIVLSFVGAVLGSLPSTVLFIISAIFLIQAISRISRKETVNIYGQPIADMPEEETIDVEPEPEISEEDQQRLEEERKRHEEEMNEKYRAIAKLDRDYHNNLISKEEYEARKKELFNE